MRTLIVSLLLVLISLPVEGKEKKKAKKNDFDVGGKVYVLWAVSDLVTEPANEITLNRARVRFSWIREKILEAKLQLEFSNVDADMAAGDILRDVYLALGDPKRWHARITAGQFKRPFSRLELLGIRRVPTVHRGVANEWLVRELGFGNRDIGIQVDGTAGKDEWFGYAVGAFNGPGRNRDERGLDGSKDVAARLEFRPAKWVEIGVNTSLRTFDRGEGADLPRFTWMAGGDVVFRGGEWVRILGEGLVGEAWLLPNRPLTWSALLMVYSDAIKLPFLQARLEPVIKAELAVRDAGNMDTGIWMLATGVNLHLLKRFRVMLHGEFIWPGDDEATRLESPQQMRLLVQLALDV